MAAKLEIVWDGNVPGLAEHRLSLDAFGPALKALLAAIRRIASELELQADNRRGRLAREASQLDVQFETITVNSPVRAIARVVPLVEPARPLIDDLPDLAVDRFLDGLRRESSRVPSHYQVRRFLKSLPAGLTQQSYVHTRSDGQINKVEIGEIRLPELRKSAYLVDVHGLVAGAGFETGRGEVKLRSGGDLVAFAASDEQVEQALSDRRQLVHAVGVYLDDKRRLLAINPRRLSESERAAYVLGKWGGLLSRLAK